MAQSRPAFASAAESHGTSKIPTNRIRKATVTPSRSDRQDNRTTEQQRITRDSRDRTRRAERQRVYPTPAAAGEVPHSTVSEDFTDSYSQAGLQPRGLGDNTRNAKPDYGTTGDTRSQPYQTQTVQPRRSTRINKRKEKITPKKTVKKAIRSLAYIRALTVTITIWTTGIAVWTFQFILGILALVLFAIAAAGNAVATAVTDAAGAILGSWAGQALANIGSTLGSLTGLSDLAAAPAGAAGVLLLLNLLIGIAHLGIIMGLYFLARVRPVFGRGFLFKLFGLCCVVGYIFPFINLFPLFVPYTLAVLFNPK